MVSVSYMVHQGRSRWFGHVELKSADDWVSVFKDMAVAAERGMCRSRKT